LAVWLGQRDTAIALAEAGAALDPVNKVSVKPGPEQITYNKHLKKARSTCIFTVQEMTHDSIYCEHRILKSAGWQQLEFSNTKSEVATKPDSNLLYMDCSFGMPYELVRYDVMSNVPIQAIPKNIHVSRRPGTKKLGPSVGSIFCLPKYLININH